MTRAEKIHELQRQAKKASDDRHWRRFHKIIGELAPLIKSQLRAENRMDRRKAA